MVDPLNSSYFGFKKLLVLLLAYFYLLSPCFAEVLICKRSIYNSTRTIVKNDSNLYIEDIRISGVKLGTHNGGNSLFGREPDSTEYRKEQEEQSYLVYFYGTSEIYFEMNAFIGFWIRDSSLTFSTFPSISVGKSVKIIFDQLRRFKDLNIITNNRETTIYLYLHSRELASFLDCALFFYFKDDALVNFGLQTFDV